MDTEKFQQQEILRQTLSPHLFDQQSNQRSKVYKESLKKNEESETQKKKITKKQMNSRLLAENSGFNH